MSIEDRLSDLLRELFDDPTLVVTSTTTGADVEDWDSLQHVMLMYLVEEEFGVEFSGDEAAELENLGALADLVRAKGGK